VVRSQSRGTRINFRLQTDSFLSNLDLTCNTPFRSNRFCAGPDQVLAFSALQHWIVDIIDLKLEILIVCVSSAVATARHVLPSGTKGPLDALSLAKQIVFFGMENPATLFHFDTIATASTWRVNQYHACRRP
jgi:hypothetical protein